VHNAHAEQTRSGASSVGGYAFAHPSCPSCVRAPAVLLWIGMKQAQRQEREEILPLCHKTRPAREKRTAKGVGGGCEAAPLRAHKGGVRARGDAVSIRPKTTSLHASRYYRVALSLVLNKSKLWVKGLLPFRGER
jgi:hypothetical protein